jgi:molybdopterin/thiamine biosynthesis adenylyltransferase
VTATGSEPWYGREPERLQWELDQFERHGLSSDVSYDKNGRLIVATEVRFRKEPLAVTATYSHGHPYLPPTIAADRYVLGRHQDPAGRHFCLLGTNDEGWRPCFSAAQLIGKSLRRLLRDSEEGREAVYTGEADMPEPVSQQFVYDQELVVLVGQAFLVRELGATSGTMSLVRGPGRIRVLAEATGIGVLDCRLAAGFGGAGAATLVGRWVALDSAPRPEQRFDGILAALAIADGQPLARLARRLKGKRGIPQAKMLVGLTFIEEGPTRDEQRRAWLFAEIGQKHRYQPRVLRLLPAQALSALERARRLPELAALSETHVLVIGAGSLGAPTALELAKAGVGQLEIFDGDRYDVNNAVRHILPATQAGGPKAESVAEFCRSLNPFVDVRAHPLAIGDSAEANACLADLLATATVVIDTTGVQSIARFLEAKSRAAGASLIVAGLTASSYGADVFVIAPGGACFDCFTRAQDEGLIPKPPAGERSAVTPFGCRHPAFAGAGFEATELAAVVARRAVQATGATLYPGTDSNWFVLDFRGGRHFHEGRLEPLPDCDRHW